MSRQPAKCGTPSGYRRHWKAKEPACDACKSAVAAWQREYRAANERIREERKANSQAHNRARKRLLALHHDEYLALVEEEKGRAS